MSCKDMPPIPERDFKCEAKFNAFAIGSLRVEQVCDVTNETFSVISKNSREVTLQNKQGIKVTVFDIPTEFFKINSNYLLTTLPVDEAHSMAH